MGTVRDSLRKEIGGPKSRSGCCGEENDLHLPRIEPRIHGLSAHSLVAVPEKVLGVNLKYISN
jgi:hypothetical protein